jgi:hypothetical protein
MSEQNVNHILTKLGKPISGTLMLGESFRNDYFSITSMDPVIPVPFQDLPNFGLILKSTRTHKLYHAVFSVKPSGWDFEGVQLSSLIDSTVNEFTAMVNEKGYEFDDYCFDPRCNITSPRRSNQLRGLLRSVMGQFNFNVRSELKTAASNRVFQYYLRFDLVVRGFNTKNLNKVGCQLDCTHDGKNAPKGMVRYHGQEVVFFLHSDSHMDMSTYVGNEDVEKQIRDKFTELWPFDPSMLEWVFYPPSCNASSLYDTYHRFNSVNS